MQLPPFQINSTHIERARRSESSKARERATSRKRQTNAPKAHQGELIALSFALN